MKAKKQHGHYCKVCDTYKSNESFSGKGHNAHICKKCASLSVEERNKQIALNKIFNIGFGYLSKEQKTWLENKTKDSRPEIREAACEAYNNIFPYAQINKKKKQLLLKEFSLFINAEVYYEYGSEQVNCKFHVSGEYITKEDEKGKKSVKLPKPEIRKILRIIVHNYEVFTWHEGNTIIDEFDIDTPYTWRIDCVYATAGDNQTVIGNEEYLDDNVEMLYFELNGYFDEE